jgi:hypothetical protein
MQKRSGTFKTTLAVVVGITAVVLAVASAMAHYLLEKSPVTPPVAHAKATPKPAAPAAAPVAPAAAAPAGQAVLFRVRASVSTDDGPDVAIEATPTSEPCTEPRWLDAREVHVAPPADALKVRSEASWCVRVAPGQRFTPETLEGRWVTLTERVLSVDAAHQYMRVQHASGRWLGIRAIAAGYCASESSTCSGTALVEVSVDDRNLLVPLAVSSRSREVLRLTREAELAQVTTRRATAPQPAEAEEPAEASPADAAQSEPAQ